MHENFQAWWCPSNRLRVFHAAGLFVWCVPLICSQSPALELDDGSIIAETAVICEYLEELHPTPVLIGRTPEERAHSRTWQRRVELNITENIYNGFRYAEGYELFKDRLHCIPAAAADLKATAQERLAWLDGLMGNKPFICGDELRQSWKFDHPSRS